MDLDRNNLDMATSPYLHQHRDNPVHWQPWSAQILTTAQQLNKPILLSVGYAACHWCHVMAHESFESDEIAAIMNALFINVKVDREERPDLDSIYQNALSLFGQPGGWPLTMFLTPEGNPFWGGTYFPAEPRYGRPGFPDVLRAVSETYHEKPDTIAGNVAQLKTALKRMNTAQAGAIPDIATIDQLANACLKIMDLSDGGTRGAPKFPQPSLLGFLLRAGRRSDNQVMTGAVLLSLDRMCQGGIYDHLAGGFARYSVDADWLVPHFEKMLYDNAQLIDLMTEAWQLTKSPLYQQRIAETCDWLLEEMRVQTGFAASYDADSEGEEGKFYVWSKAEIEAALGADAQDFNRIYDVDQIGNWEGHTILNRTQSGLTLADEATEAQLAACRKILRNLRAKRIWPGWDNKVLTDWNGLAITALARASAVFERADWQQAAIEAYRFILDTMSEETHLFHSYRQGLRQHAGMLDDYAQMIRAAVTLYEITGDDDYLDQAEIWVDRVMAELWDPDQGGFFHAPAAEDIVVRQKPVTDNALPSGNGTLAEILARLFLITGKTRYRDLSENTVRSFAGALPEQFPNNVLLLDAAETLQRNVQIVLAGENTEALARLFHSLYLPHATLVQLSDTTHLDDMHPAKGKRADVATAYICAQNTCSPPITEIAAFKEALEQCAIIADQ